MLISSVRCVLVDPKFMSDSEFSDRHFSIFVFLKFMSHSELCDRLFSIFFFVFVWLHM
jgi:hypothetical protein